VNQDGSINEIENKYDVYFYRDIIMYRMYFLYDSSSNGQNLIHEQRTKYFIFTKGSVWGNFYASNPNQKILEYKGLVDSVVRLNSFDFNKFDTLKNKKPDSAYFDNNGGTFVKIYTPATSDSFPETFKIKFYYTEEHLDIEQYLSKAMDNETRMKLTKISVEAQGWFYKQYNVQFPPRKFIMEMRQLNIENKDEIFSYFKKYKEL
jgi:hypothetical protein